MNKNTKRILIIGAILVAIYLVYYFLIRKWMENSGMNTKINDYTSSDKKPLSSFYSQDIQVISFDSVQGLERV